MIGVDVALINLPCHTTYLTTDSMEDYRGGHIGQGYLASSLEKNGISVELIDCSRMHMELPDLFEQLSQLRPKVVGLHFYNTNITILYRFLFRIIKMENPPLIILGGRQATSFAEEFLKMNKGVDCIIRGEGEVTIVRVVQKYLSGQDWSQEDGIAYLDCNKQVVFTERSKLVDNLDDLPFPKRYIKEGQLRAGLLVTRGCVGRCTFCTQVKFYDIHRGKVFRTRSPKNVVDEMEQLYKAGIHFLMIDSDNFLFADVVYKNWVNEFCELIKERQIHMEFQIYARSDDVTKERIEMLKEVGLRCVFLGVETGIQERLDKYHKTVTVEENKLAMKIIHEFGIYLKIGLIPFDHDSIVEDLLKEIDFLEEMKYSETGAYLAEPFSIRFPLAVLSGTEIYDELAVQNRLSKSSPYGYVFQDHRMDQYCQLIQPWQEVMRTLLKDAAGMYKAKDLEQNDIFAELMQIMKKVIHIDLKVTRRVVEDIIAGASEVVVSKEDYDELERYHQECIALSEYIP